jgi:hypothetical protein
MMDAVLAVIGAFVLVVSGINRVLDQIIHTLERLQKIRIRINRLKEPLKRKKDSRPRQR